MTKRNWGFQPQFMPGIKYRRYSVVLRLEAPATEARHGTGPFTGWLPGVTLKSTESSRPGPGR